MSDLGRGSGAHYDPEAFPTDCGIIECKTPADAQKLAKLLQEMNDAILDLRKRVADIENVPRGTLLK